MWRIREYAVFDIHGSLTKYSTLLGVINALERDGLTLDSDNVKCYATKAGVMIVDCY